MTLQPILDYVPGADAGLGKMMSQVVRVAPLESTILLSGETGTGKTRLARQIHEISPRRAAPFVVVNCGALSESLIESEMFGHVRGAFTGADRDRTGKFQEAGSGTLVLDEIDSLPLTLQAKLLRAVEERIFEPVGSNRSLKVQARLIAACNRDLEREVAQGRFRQDLYYRLNVVSFHLPALRQRRQAIGVLARKFLNEFAERRGELAIDLAPETLAILELYPWPGNIRELRNAIERAVALCPGSEVQPGDLPEVIDAWAREHSAAPAGASAASETGLATLSHARGEAERNRILEVLDKHAHNRLRTAAELGISRMTLYKKLHRLGLMATA